MDYTENGKCPDGCSKCCTSNLPLSDYEINKIKKVVRRNGIKPVNRNDRKTKEDRYIDICPFLSENGKCNIYFYRPDVCKKYSCHEALKDFNHRDKHIINFMEEFFPEYFVANLPNLTPVKAEYERKKKQAYERKTD